MKIYTKTGDKGSTSLLNGKRVAKYHPRLHAYGTVDELNSWMGMVRDYAVGDLVEEIVAIQETLFSIGSHLAVEGEASFKLPEIPANSIEKLEKAMDKMDASLPELRSFVLPGGHPAVSHCHVARTVCRRAERHIVELSEEHKVDEFIIKYVNRLSDFLFMLSRKFAQDFNTQEIAWNPK